MASCPELVCDVSGAYWCFFLQLQGSAGINVPGVPDGHYFTRLVKMNTFSGDWVGANRPFLVAENGEGNNNSDLSIINYKGGLVMSYSTGDQRSWGDIKLAIFTGSIEELWSVNTF